MNLITVRLADPQRPVYVACLADYLRGDATVQVPDVAFWRNEIRRGALVEVTTADTPPAEQAPAVELDGETAVLPPMPAPPQLSRKQRRQSKRASKPADPPPADSTRGPSLGSVITKAERFGDEE